jgi:predicted enzyme related to lactoylglutathione lyase
VTVTSQESSTDRKLGLVLDSLDPQRLAPFWALALGYVILADVDNYVALFPANGAGPKLLIQRVPEGKSVKNRMHMDVETTDVEAVAAELEANGAKRLSSLMKEHGSSWIVMNDPDGNEFCVCDGGQSGT